MKHYSTSEHLENALRSLHRARLSIDAAAEASNAPDVLELIDVSRSLLPDACIQVRGAIRTAKEMGQ